MQLRARAPKRPEATALRDTPTLATARRRQQLSPTAALAPTAVPAARDPPAHERVRACFEASSSNKVVVIGAHTSMIVQVYTRTTSAPAGAALRPCTRAAPAAYLEPLEAVKKVASCFCRDTMPHTYLESVYETFGHLMVAWWGSPERRHVRGFAFLLEHTFVTKLKTPPAPVCEQDELYLELMCTQPPAAPDAACASTSADPPVRIGTLMLEAIKTFARGRGARRLVLFSIPSALTFWQHRGFVFADGKTCVENATRYPAQPELGVKMHLVLTVDASAA